MKGILKIVLNTEDPMWNEFDFTTISVMDTKKLLAVEMQNMLYRLSGKMRETEKLMTFESDIKMITESQEEHNQFQSILFRLRKVADNSENDRLSDIIEELENLVKGK